MTGYARVRRPAEGGGEVTVSVKSVNHRGLDIHIHTSLDLTVENEIRSTIKKRLTRGHIEVRVGFLRAQAGESVALNRTLFGRRSRGESRGQRADRGSQRGDACARHDLFGWRSRTDARG
jgi:uncharacterized protein YicC (UPF0701 family)